MTYIQIINAVQRRLRETVTSLSTSTEYSTLISDFVLSTKREVESAWNWTSLRAATAVTTVQSTTSYDMTSAGKRFTTQDVYDTTSKAYLKQIAPYIGRVDILNATEGPPRFYFYEGISATGDLKVKFSPVPDGVYVVNFNLIVPQTDTPSDTDEITMDEWPIIMGAWAKAVEERGEDGGKAALSAAAQYKQALDDAIALDIARQQTEDTWDV